jgi:hypothetical protein
MYDASRIWERECPTQRKEERKYFSCRSTGRKELGDKTGRCGLSWLHRKEKNANCLNSFDVSST